MRRTLGGGGRAVNREWPFESDKAWDEIHRCLGDGSLLYGTGPHPLTYAVLGGLALDAAEHYTVCICDPDQVAEAAEALPTITREWMRARFERCAEAGLIHQARAEDFEYVWSYFEGLREFFARAAEAERPVLFTVDC